MQEWEQLHTAVNAVGKALRHAASTASLIENTPDDILPRHDDSVLFTSAAICRFKAGLIGGHEAPNGFVQQWCFRDRNFALLLRGETPRWNSCFRQFGTIAPVDHLGAQLATLTQELKVLTHDWGGVLGLNAFSADADLVAAAKEVGVPLDLGRNDPTYYRHRYGHERLSGRNANFFVARPNESFRTEFGNVIVIERDGVPYAIEIAIGLETLATTLVGKPSAVWANIVNGANTFDMVNQSLVIVDVLGTVLNLHATGVRPFATNRGRIFRRYLILLSDLLVAQGLSPSKLVGHCAPIVCKERQLPFYDAHWIALVDYLEECYRLPSNLTAFERNAKLASSWADRWPRLEAHG